MESSVSMRIRSGVKLTVSAEPVSMVLIVSEVSVSSTQRVERVEKSRWWRLKRWYWNWILLTLAMGKVFKTGARSEVLPSTANSLTEDFVATARIDPSWQIEASLRRVRVRRMCWWNVQLVSESISWREWGEFQKIRERK